MHSFFVLFCFVLCILTQPIPSKLQDQVQGIPPFALQFKREFFIMLNTQSGLIA